MIDISQLQPLDLIGVGFAGMVFGMIYVTLTGGSHPTSTTDTVFDTLCLGVTIASIAVLFIGVVWGIYDIAEPCISSILAHIFPEG
jgi:threonine/homoserine efflux transporter RhtA